MELIKKLDSGGNLTSLNEKDYERAIALFFTPSGDAMIVESEVHTNAELVHATYLARFARR